MFNDYRDEQSIAVSLFERAIKENKISHAYLIDTNNYKKADSLILTFVKALLCPNNHLENNNNDCDFCKRIDLGNCLELKIIKPDGTWIKKEQLHELQEDFSMRAVEGNRRVYIIKECEKMNKYAANSILKFLEEPVDNIIAILVSNDVSKLLETIISRCQMIRLNSDIDKYTNTLDKLFIDDNNVEILDNLLNFIDEFENKKTGCIVNIKKIWHNHFSNRELVGQAVDLMIKYYYDVLLILSNRDIAFFTTKKEHVVNISSLNNIDSVLLKLEYLISARSILDYNVNLNLFINKLIIDMGGD